MNTRTMVTVILALVLIALVMCVAAAMSYTGWAGSQKFDYRELWQQPYANTQSMKIIDLTGDKQDDLFVQNLRNVVYYDSSGQVQLSLDFPADIVSTLGDADGDGVEDALAFWSQDGQGQVAVISRGQVAANFPVAQIGQAARAAVLRFPEGVQIVLGDGNGQLVSLAPDGRELWRTNLSAGAEIRGLDDALVDGQVRLAAANRNGAVALYDAAGNALWNYQVPGGLRRLRAYDLNSDGAGEIVLGGENGQLIVLDAATTLEKVKQSLGQTITEIRDGEVDGDPASREIIAGGKEGGVWAYTASGKQLWSRNASERVTEIAALEVDGDGVEEVLIGDEGGELTLYAGAQGETHSLASYSQPINRIDAGRLSGPRQVAVADAGAVRLLELEQSAIPALRFTPLLAGLIVSAVILVAAWFIATLPAKPPVKVSLEDQSIESLQAQRRMLKESLADVERLKSAGEMTPDAYLKRLKELRSQLADNDAALKKAGVPFKPETFACPNCGGSLPIGIDRCDYCGQTVIT